MLRTLRFAIQVVAMVGLFAMTAPAFAGGQAGAVQLAFHEKTQTAALPTGRVSLRVIERVGGPTLKAPIKWRIMTYGRDDAGRRHKIAEVTGATVELVLPAAWYIAYAQLPDREIKHPIEVTAGKSFNYTLVMK